MNKKTLKYIEHLKDFPDCPSSNFVPIEGDFFRWVHENASHKNDFSPINIIGEPPPRMLDETDKLCKGFGLSLFDTIHHAIATYEATWKRQRNKETKDKFIDEKGTSIAVVSIVKNDGLADTPSKTGHFTFHEYNDCDLSKSIKKFFNIFESNGAFNIQ